MIFYVGRIENINKNLPCNFCKKADKDHVFKLDLKGLQIMVCEQCCVSMEKTLKSRHWAVGMRPLEENHA